MFRCHNCGGTEARRETVSEVFQMGEHNILVDHIPAQVCARCGEAVFSRETTEKIRLMLHGDAQPVKVVQMEVFEYA
jgi:YgiT-type zinc finger domain-containing protein